MQMLSFDEVAAAIQDEMTYQDDKWGADKQQSLPGYMIVMENELRKAREGWCADKSGRASALAELLQVVTVGVRCLQRYGVTGWAIATDDIAQDDYDDNCDRWSPEVSNIELAVPQGVKVVELTLRDGSPIYIAKAAFQRAINNRGFGSKVLTARGSYDVQQSVRQIQQMMQD
jgi:hypothetical protein